MVNVIDAEARRRHLAEAVWRLIVRGGLEAASVRGVALETGLAAGSVRHFFPSQGELHSFAMKELIAAVTFRVQAAARLDDPLERAVAMLVELLPVTDQTAVEFAAYLEFMDRSRTDPGLREVAQESVRAVRELVVAILTDGERTGLLRRGLAAEDEAVRLHAALDGLMWQLLVAPGLHTRDQVHGLVRDWLTDLTRAT